MKIMDNAYQTRFIVDWGKGQRYAKAADRIFSSNQRDMLYGSCGYKEIVRLLKSLSPEVYKGGPDPELPYEPRWLMDYKTTVSALENSTYKKVYFQNGSTTYSRRIKSYDNIDIVFSKED